MADKNMKRISDEELENVAGGRLGRFALNSEKARQKEDFVEEAKKRINPNDPLSWFQTVADVFDEKFEKK
ncbi:hypothetical protein [Butyrivibrio sp. JL13D10]|uniref:hypothetical protein n=1 Tax=Butyrivibrio sp. JL13D10 TaxID=3236815 RepID=UPI0038B5985E